MREQLSFWTAQADSPVPSSPRRGYDLALANPPFGVKISESRILSRFELAHRGLKQTRTCSETLFMEQLVRLLAPGGRLSAVVPDSILSTSSHQTTRDFISDRCRLRAVLSLHEHSFRPFTTQKTSILSAQRWNDDEREGELCARVEDYPVALGISEQCGRDGKGRVSAKSDLAEAVRSMCRLVRGEAAAEEPEGEEEDGERFGATTRADKLMRATIKTLEEGREQTGYGIWELFRRLLFEMEKAVGLKTDEETQERALTLSNSVAERLSAAAHSMIHYAKAEMRELLGAIYMNLGASEPRWGQFFTRYEDARACAQIALALPLRAPTEERPLLVIDPACGAGVLLIAAASLLPRLWIERGLVRFTAVDSDPMCVRIARLNFSLFGLAGEARREDGLLLETNESNISLPLAA